jgi:hypothetical protein
MAANATETNPWIQWQQAMVQEGFANLRRLARLPSLWQKAQELKKGATPSEVLNIMGRSDDLVPSAQSLPFNDLVASTDRKSILFPSGHIGLAVSAKAQTQLWPEACQWLAERSGVLEPAPRSLV